MHLPRTSVSAALVILTGLTCGAAASCLLDGAFALVCISIGAACAGASVHALRHRTWFCQQIHRPATAIVEQALRAARGQRPSRPLVSPDSPLAQLAEVVGDALLGMDDLSQASLANYSTLEAAFEQVHSVLHSMGQGVIVEDSRTGVVLINPIARSLLGLAEHDRVEGRPMADLFPPEIREQVSRVIAERWRSEEPASAAGVRFHERVIDLSIAPVRGVRKRKASGSVMALLDVTRSHEVQRLKDDFIRSVSHELLTPLTSIRSFTEILLDMTPADEVTWREFVGIVNLESDKLMRLLNDVLDLAQLDAGQLELAIKPVELRAVFHTIHGAFESVAREWNIRFDLSVERAVGGVLADPARMHQVLTNLVGNAFKFTPPSGHILLTAALNEDRVRVAVEDSGPGIPDEKRDRVFERFSQLGPTLTGKPKGTGLGLVLCRELLGGMGGTIWLEESDLGGARMVFELPACGPTGGASPDVDTMKGQSEQVRAARHAAGGPKVAAGG